MKCDELRLRQMRPLRMGMMLAANRVRELLLNPEF